MKKSMYTTLAIILMLTTQINAQLELGVKTGFNFSNAAVDGVINGLLPETRVLIGNSTGIVANIPLGSGFSIAPEILYTQKGFTIRESMNLDILGLPVSLGASIHNKIDYIETPLLIRYTKNFDNINVFTSVGPTIGYATSARTEIQANVILDIDLGGLDLDLSSDNYRRLDTGFAIGAGAEYKLPNGKLFSEFRYQHGLTDIIDNTIIDIQVRNRGYGLTMGYAMRF